MLSSRCVIAGNIQSLSFVMDLLFDVDYLITGLHSSRTEALSVGREALVDTDVQSTALDGNLKLTSNTCLRGQYYTEQGCLTCPRGYVSNDFATECKKCDEGTYIQYSSDWPQMICTPCPTGTYSAEFGSSACTTCPEGYSTPAGQTACYPGTSCPKGYYKPPGGSACEKCSAGTYTDITTATACTKCPIGSSAPAGGSSCTSCTMGQYIAAGSICTSCLAGKFTNTTTATECTKCSVGSSSPAAASSCTPCPLGTYNNLAGYSCSKCYSGTYADTTGSKIVLLDHHQQLVHRHATAHIVQ